MNNVAEDIKARVDIVHYVGQFVQLKKAGKLYKACCPFHGEKTASFVVNPERQTWHCFGSCAEGGDVIAFAMKRQSWKFGEALQELGKLAGIEVKPRDPVQNEKQDRLMGMMKLAADVYHKCLLGHPAARPAREYIQKRGLKPETVESFYLGYAPAQWDTLVVYLREQGYSDEDMLLAGVAVKNERGVFDMLRNRLIFPICDPRGRVIALAGRALADDAQPKYLNTAASPIFDKSRVLYAFRRENVKDTVVIVEGYMDAITAHEAGFTNVVAQMGTALTEKHLKLLQNANRIVLALDGDAAGQAAAQRNLETLVRSERDTRILTLVGGKDPDEIIRADPSAWSKHFDTAEPIADYIVRTGCQDVPPGAPVAVRYEAAKKLLPMLMRCEIDVIRKVNVQMLANHLKLPTRELMNLAQNPKAEVIAPEETPGQGGLQYAILASFLTDELIYARCMRRFRELHLPEMTVDDFMDSGAQMIFRLFLEGWQQLEMDIEDFVRRHVDPVLSDRLNTAPITDEKQLRRSALQLRAQRLQDEANYFLESEEPDAAQLRIMQRMKILLEAG